MAPLISSMTVNEDNMLRAAQEGFINATDLADYLVKKGLPFRTAYKISGEIVSRCISEGFVLETLPLDIYLSYSDLFSEDIYEAIDLSECLRQRVSEGGPSEASVSAQIEYIRGLLAENG